MTHVPAPTMTTVLPVPERKQTLNGAAENAVTGSPADDVALIVNEGSPNVFGGTVSMAIVWSARRTVRSREGSPQAVETARLKASPAKLTTMRYVPDATAGVNAGET